MKNLAAQGRTVLVSSHLISEIAHTADALIVIAGVGCSRRPPSLAGAWSLTRRDA